MTKDRLTGRTILITGGTGGIGLVTARRLAEQGATVLIVGSNRGRGESALSQVREAAPGARVTFHQADLSDLAQVRTLSETVRALHPRLDVLVNNAGGMFGQRTLSPQGIEMTFALNHLSYFLLSHLLLPSLEAAAPGRIVNVASEAHRGVRLDFNDLEGKKRYSAWGAYKRSKLANLLFTYEMARRTGTRAVTVNALHPGFVATGIGVRNRFVPAFIWSIAKLAAIDVEQGADTSVHLASSPDVAGDHGRYFIKCRPARSSEASQDRLAAERLWRESVRLTDLEIGLQARTGD
jgi:NAD(P)-dependent dehydrogenase (short-subunit alcohol dehydrogenase family)